MILGFNGVEYDFISLIKYQTKCYGKYSVNTLRAGDAHANQ